MSSAAPPSSSLMKWVIPAVLFVVIIGAIAFVSQNLPKGVTKKPVDVPPPKGPRAGDLRFLYTVGAWDENDPSYSKEYEPGTEGHYDFPFLNPNSYPVTLVFNRASCDCSTLKVTLLDATSAEKLQALKKPSPSVFADEALKWISLTKDDKTGLEVPPGGAGLARLEWHGRKAPRDSLRINIQVAMHPTASPDDRSFEQLMVPVTMSEAIRFLPDRLSLGTIGPGGVETGEMFAWSPTRPNLELKVDVAKLDSLFDVKITKVDAKAADALRARLQQTALNRIDSAEMRKNTEAVQAKENRETRILVGYQINVTLREQKGNDQLDQGHFSRELPIAAADVPFNPPAVTAFIRGDVTVGITEDGGKINLKTFPAKAGVKRSIHVTCDGDADLVIENAYPKALDVKLIRDKSSTASRGRWSLDVSVAPGAWYGPFSDDATIILRTNGTPPRKIRVPVIGVGGQG